MSAPTTQTPVDAEPGLRPARPPSWRTAGPRVIAFAVMTVVLVAALVVGGLSVAYIRQQSNQDRLRASAAHAAQEFTAQVNDYTVRDIGHYQARVAPLLTPGYRNQFAAALRGIVWQVRQSQLRSRGQVLRSAVASIDPDSATVLVVADATVRTTEGTRIRHFRWQVSLVRRGGRWLVDDFMPVA